MFLRLLSPKGGVRLSSLHTYPVEKQENVTISKPETCIVKDFFCLKLGYLENDLKKGQPIFIKPSDAKDLYKILKREIGSIDGD